MKLDKYLLLKVLMSILIFFYIFNQSRSLGDFTIYLGAAELLKNSETCYNVWIETKPGEACGYSYSPFFATILIPLTILAEPIPQILWLLINVFFLYRIVVILKSFTKKIKLSKRQNILWLLFSIIFSIRFVLHNFEMVQMTIFLVYCSLEAVNFSEQKKYIKSAFLLSFAIIIKILPVVLLPYFLFRKKIKEFGLAILSLVCFILFPSIFLGWDFNLQLHKDWINIINPFNEQFVVLQNNVGEGIHSLSGLYAGYFTVDNNKVNAPFNRSLISLTDEKLSLLLNTSRIILILLSLYFLKLIPFKKSKNLYFTFWELSYLLLITPLIFPHQQKYAFFYLAPASAFVIHYIISAKINIHIKYKKKIIIILMILFFALSTLTTDGVVGNEFNDIMEYYKSITFGSFLLLISLMLSNPKYSSFNNTKNS